MVTLRQKLATIPGAEAKRLDVVADYLVKKSVWAVGGDGWAYDIGYGGLDHVMAMNRDVNILVLDTEVYSNTGGQQSKATPMGAAAKFAVAGQGARQEGPRDDGDELRPRLRRPGRLRRARTSRRCKAFQEADSYHGTSLIIAYSHCIAHGYDLGARLRAAEARRRRGYLAALPVRSAADRRGAAAADPRRASRPGRGSPTTRRTRPVSGWWRSSTRSGSST